MQGNIYASIFCPIRELDRFADKEFVIAVIYLDWRKPGQIGVEQIDAGIVPRHTSAAEPRLAKPFQQGLERSLSFPALLSIVPLFSSKSYHGATDRMAAGISARLLRSAKAKLTAKFPPID